MCGAWAGKECALYPCEKLINEGSGFILGCNTAKVLDKCIQRIDRTKKKYKTNKVSILNDSLGANGVFKCNNCGLKADRDLHAARNILLRHLV